MAREKDERMRQVAGTVPTWAGFLFLAVVIDVWSRKVIGWSTANHLKTELVVAAFDMAIAQRQQSVVIHHSDLGSTRR